MLTAEVLTPFGEAEKVGGLGVGAAVSKAAADALSAVDSLVVLPRESFIRTVKV
jgi:hypothetical protein